MIARWTAELGMALLTGLFGLVTVIGAIEYGIGWSSSGPEPGAFPFYIGLMITFASVGNLVSALMTHRRAEGKPFLMAAQLRLVAGFTLPIVGFVVVSLLLGLYVGMALYMFGTLVFQNNYSMVKASIISLSLPVATYFLIERAFKVGMLKGPLEAALGL
jgi:hypothetical protein